ncbi:hypothetical protein CYY_010510 [Polysphondylium violaceum]|uniref:Cation/H+ exchanger transmembrane domain-containing protein n=1 Tax=Polysphondylium violaceum TaxID=133409 RepID=A0A8J4PKJ2_9MYCE|nr:hypothetical protein CYY_010510 [Polysphondylium violaceum]
MGKWFLKTIVLIFLFLCTQVLIIDGETLAVLEEEEPELNYGCRDIIGCGPEETKQVLITLVLVFAATVIVYFLSSYNVHFLPESIAVVIFGIIFGIIDKYTPSHLLDIISSFNPDHFFLFLLPIIIFETGFTLPKKAFFDCFPCIIILAIFGTVIAFLITGIGLWALGEANLSKHISAREGLLIGAIGCSTDPVATLAIFKALDVDVILYIIVLGESIVNDSIALVLFKASLTYSLSEIWRPILIFIDIGKYPALESIFILIFSYISYLIADCIGFSGILSAFCAGITMSQYGYKGLSETTKNTISQVFRGGSFIGETVAFIYIGISLPINDYEINMALVGWTIFLFLIGRAVTVYPTFFVLNIIKIQPHVSKRVQFVVWFSGLRGAISFALSLSPFLNDYPDVKYIRTTILLLVYFTLFVFGIGTYPILKLFKIKMNVREQTLESMNIIDYERERFGRVGTAFKKYDIKVRNFFARSYPPIEMTHERTSDISSFYSSSVDSSSDISFESGLDNTPDTDSSFSETTTTDSFTSTTRTTNTIATPSTTTTNDIELDSDIGL